MLNPDFKDMLSALSDEGVEFLLVGAYALAAHGRPQDLADAAWLEGAPSDGSTEDAR